MRIGKINNSTPPRAFWVENVSVDSAPLISIVAGSVTDLTNSGAVWTGISGNIIYMIDPIAGNVPFAKPLTGPPVRQPYLQLSSSTTCCYLEAEIDNATGFIIAMDILADSGGGKPDSDSTHWRELLSSLTVTIIGGKASVACANDGAQSSIYFKSCGRLPLDDGNGYTVGT